MKMAKKVKLPEFKGKPIQFNGDNSQIDFLREDFGKAFLEEYQWRVKANYNGNQNLNVLKYNKGVIKGSNPFAVVLANQILREERLRTATHTELEKALRINILDGLKGFYEDTGLVLRSEDDNYPNNNFITKNIASQVKKKGIEFNPKNPALIPLVGLELEKDNNYYGLTFKLTDEQEIIHAPQLSYENNKKMFHMTDKNGLPIFYKDGSNILVTKHFGLSRLNWHGELDLNSSDWNLEDSGDAGIMVIVKD